MSRSFQVVSYRAPIEGADRFDITKPATERTVPAKPTFVHGLTARVAVEPACTRFGVHYSGLELKEWDGTAFPDDAVHLNPPPQRSVQNLRTAKDIEREIRRMRNESYAKLRPKKRRRQR